MLLPARHVTAHRPGRTFFRHEKLGRGRHDPGRFCRSGEPYLILFTVCNGETCRRSPDRGPPARSGLGEQWTPTQKEQWTPTQKEQWMEQWTPTQKEQWTPTQNEASCRSLYLWWVSTLRPWTCGEICGRDA